MTQKSEGLPRITELDGLRGFAILLVISFHYLNNQLLHANSVAGHILKDITGFGWVGVDLFFVLSGFLIGSILITHKGSYNFFTTFYIRRIVRIIPNYFLLLFIFFITYSVSDFKNDYFLTGNMVIPFWSYFAMIHNIYMGVLNSMGNDSLSITWSIGIEEQFYLFFPLIIYFIPAKWIPYLLLTAILAAPVIRFSYSDWIPAYVLLLCRMDSIAFGILIAYSNSTASLRLLVHKYFKWLYIILAADIIICGLLYSVFGDLGSIKHTLFAMVFSIAVLFALNNGDSLYKRLLRLKPLVWTGKISYSLYLFNYLILGLCHHILGNRSGIGIGNFFDSLVSVVALLITFGFSWMVYKWFETPMVKLGKTYSY